MNIPSAIQEFSNLSIDQQKEKVSEMLLQIKDSDQVFLDLFDIIKKNNDIDSAFLTDTYKDILEFADAIANYNLSNQKKALSSLQNKLQELHEREAKERIIEQQEVEEMIKNI